MVHSVGERGYDQTTVAHVIARAGASRRTFYVQFPNRHACLMAAAEQIAARWEQSTRAAVDTAIENDEDPVEAFVHSIFDETVASCAALRLIVVELGAVAGGAHEREALLRALAGTLRAALEDGGPGRDWGQDGAEDRAMQAVVGGICRVAYVRALNGPRVHRVRRSQLLPLAEHVARWARCYGGAPPPPEPVEPAAPPPAGGRAPGTLSLSLNASERSMLPRGEGALSRSLVVHSQRERLLDAIANLSARRGHQSIAIPDIVQEAGVSVQTFYEQFEGREDMLTVAYELGRHKMLALVERTPAQQPDWESSIRARISTLLGFLASEPSFAHLAFVDVPAAGGKLAVRAHDQAFDEGNLLEDASHKNGNGTMPSQVAVECSARALHELCYARVAAGAAAELQSLVDLATYLVVTPRRGVAQIER